MPASGYLFHFWLFKFRRTPITHLLIDIWPPCLPIDGRLPCWNEHLGLCTGTAVQWHPAFMSPNLMNQVVSARASYAYAHCMWIRIEYFTTIRLGISSTRGLGLLLPTVWRTVGLCGKTIQLTILTTQKVDITVCLAIDDNDKILPPRSNALYSIWQWLWSWQSLGCWLVPEEYTNYPVRHAPRERIETQPF